MPHKKLEGCVQLTQTSHIYITKAFTQAFSAPLDLKYIMSRSECDMCAEWSR